MLDVDVGHISHCYLCDGDGHAGYMIRYHSSSLLSSLSLRCRSVQLHGGDGHAGHRMGDQSASLLSSLSLCCRSVQLHGGDGHAGHRTGQLEAPVPRLQRVPAVHAACAASGRQHGRLHRRQGQAHGGVDEAGQGGQDTHHWIQDRGRPVLQVQVSKWLL